MYLDLTNNKDCLYKFSSSVRSRNQLRFLSRLLQHLTHPFHIFHKFTLRFLPLKISKSYILTYIADIYAQKQEM